MSTFSLHRSHQSFDFFCSFYRLDESLVHCRIVSASKKNLFLELLARNRDQGRGDVPSAYRHLRFAGRFIRWISDIDRPTFARQ